MPELPDLDVYVNALDRHCAGREIAALKVLSPFVLRTVEPTASAFAGLRVDAASRLGKQLVLHAGELVLVIHLMVAGRLVWHEGKRPPSRDRNLLLRLEIGDGTLELVERSKKKRARVHLLQRADLPGLDRGGIEVLSAGEGAFSERLRGENHTVKRALTDPRLFAGIGNAYSDEILYAAQLSPLVWTSRLSDQQINHLYRETCAVLTTWRDRLLAECGDRFPAKVTAFRPEMAVHGKFGNPCPRCQTPVQRIRYVENECNYCPSCQTGGKVLADRSLSRLLKADWPRTVEELEQPGFPGAGE